MLAYCWRQNNLEMLGVKEGHTIFCDDDCNYVHHDVLVKLLSCRRNDTKTFENFKLCVKNMVAHGWDINSEIPDNLQYFRFPLVHWTAVYGKLAVLKWLAESEFDVAVTNKEGENALHRLVACQAHERAVDMRHPKGAGRRYSMSNIVQMFTKVVEILTDKNAQMLLWYDYTERNTPLQLCLKLFTEATGNTRLANYYETIFHVLCERLVGLVKKGKLRAEFVRKTLALRDSSGSNLWHVAAKTKSTRVLSGVILIVNNVKDIDLTNTNKAGDTPCMVALKSAFAQFAAFLQEHVGPTLIVPMVKTELLPELSQCHCEQKGTTESQEGYTFNLHDSSVSDSSQIETSPHLSGPRPNGFSMVDEQSFTEPLKMFTVIDQPKVVLTNPEVPCIMVNQGGGFVTTECNMDNSEDGNKSTRNSCSSHEEILVEKQIDLVVNVPQPDSSRHSYTPETSSQNSDSTDTGICTSLEISPCTENDEKVAAVNEVLNLLRNGSERTIYNNIEENSSPKETELSSPSTNNHNTNQETEHVAVTPILADSNTKGVKLTPVLLIKLLSEPDVSERFQSLLKEVITGDVEKVDSTQSTLEKLNSSKDRLDTDINSGEENLKDIASKKGFLIDAIEKLQVKLNALQNSEDSTTTKVDLLRKERGDVCNKIKECESTCNRLKRRLSDCTGALTGLSPKQLKIT